MEEFDCCKILMFLTETWNIFAGKITELTEGSAKCFIIESKTGKYFFKVYQKKFHLNTLSNEISTCEFLTKKGFLVSTFLPSKNCRYVENFNGKLCTLQNFIDGITYHKFEVPKNLLYDSVRVLANMNIALEELPIQLPLGFDHNWFFEWSRDLEIENYNKLLAQLNCDDENYNKIAKDFEIKCKLLSLFDPDVFPFTSLTFENTHGDYNVLQLIFSRDGVKAVIDFSSCAKIPICWELIRSYSLSSEECKYGIIDINNFADYIREYLKIKKLNKLDLELMPYFYFFTLLRSSFGYKGYIEKKNNGLLVDLMDIKTLEFAFWRTNMCKWMFDNANYISSKLKKLVI